MGKDEAKIHKEHNAIKATLILCLTNYVLR
jgi:hypothetical protein